jgi:hypothetical protein
MADELFRDPARNPTISSGCSFPGNGRATSTE